MRLIFHHENRFQGNLKHLLKKNFVLILSEIVRTIQIKRFLQGLIFWSHFAKSSQIRAILMIQV